MKIAQTLNARGIKTKRNCAWSPKAVVSGAGRIRPAPLLDRNQDFGMESLRAGTMPTAE